MLRFLLRTLTKFVVLLGFYLFYGIILLETTELNPNSATFLAIDIAAGVVSTVVLTIANIAVGEW